MNISAGDQFKPEFLAIAPNNRIPAIVDTAPADGGAPISVFDPAPSCNTSLRRPQVPARRHPRRTEVMQWLFWQMGGLGPMAGQNHHFVQYAAEKLPYAINRYVNETTASTAC